MTVLWQRVSSCVGQVSACLDAYTNPDIAGPTDQTQPVNVAGDPVATPQPCLQLPSHP